MKDVCWNDCDAVCCRACKIVGNFFQNTSLFGGAILLECIYYRIVSKILCASFCCNSPPPFGEDSLHNLDPTPLAKTWDGTYVNHLEHTKIGGTHLCRACVRWMTSTQLFFFIFDTFTASQGSMTSCCKPQSTTNAVVKDCTLRRHQMRNII